MLYSKSKIKNQVQLHNMIGKKINWKMNKKFKLARIKYDIDL